MNKNPPLLPILLLIGLAGPVEPLFAAADYDRDPEGTIERCRACHDNPRRQRFLKRSNLDLHHLLHGTEIKSPAAPNAATDEDGRYDCMTCHPSTMTRYGIDITAERDCLECHDRSAYWPSRHHARIERLQDSGAIPESALACFLCHDFEVDGNGELTGRIRFFPE